VVPVSLIAPPAAAAGPGQASSTRRNLGEDPRARTPRARRPVGPGHLSLSRHPRRDTHEEESLSLRAVGVAPAQARRVRPGRRGPSYLKNAPEHTAGRPVPTQRPDSDPGDPDAGPNTPAAAPDYNSDMSRGCLRPARPPPPSGSVAACRRRRGGGRAGCEGGDSGGEAAEERQIASVYDKPLSTRPTDRLPCPQCPSPSCRDC
jgi:hypothetical protein